MSAIVGVSGVAGAPPPQGGPWKLQAANRDRIRTETVRISLRDHDEGTTLERGLRQLRLQDETAERDGVRFRETNLIAARTSGFKGRGLRDPRDSTRLS
jgi:hypothetical protein